MKYSGELVDTIRAAAAYYEKRELDMLKAFSGINCNTGNVEGSRIVTNMIKDVFSEMDVELEEFFVENLGYHLVATITPEHPTGHYIISAHTDTAFDDGDVELHPYREEGNLAYGLGIGDCKGGLVVSLFAVKLLQERGLLPDKKLTFICNCDEETGSFSGRELYARYCPGADGAFVFERGRGDGSPITSRRGVTEAKVECFGKSNHAARYNLASSALEELCFKIIDMKEHNDYEHGIYYSVGPACSNTSHINKVPDYAYCELCAMMSDEKEKEEIDTFLKSLETYNHIDGCTTKVTLRFLYPPMPWTQANRDLAEIYDEAARVLGYEYTEQPCDSVGDCSQFAALGIPSIDALGPMSVGSHTYDENMEIDSVKKRTEIFALMLAGMR